MGKEKKTTTQQDFGQLPSLKQTQAKTQSTAREGVKGYLFPMGGGEQRTKTQSHSEVRNTLQDIFFLSFSFFSIFKNNLKGVVAPTVYQQEPQVSSSLRWLTPAF